MTSIVSRAPLLALCLALWACATAAARAPLGPESYLRTDGRQLRDRAGRAVTLRGVNLGGWLVTEGWMGGQSDDGGRWALEQLEARFGRERAAVLMDAWYDHWLTTRDLDRISEFGFNLVRVPFGYRNLQDADGQWRRNARGEVDFSRLDWIVAEAGQRGLYVVLDLHIWPGQREHYERISRLTPEGETDRARAAALWSQVARHFRGHGAIAAFDLINEPEGSPGDLLQRVLYEAIRQQDPERIVIGESMRYANFSDPYWTNAVWSAHYPGDEQPGTEEERVARWERAQGLTDHPEVRVPVFIGETKCHQDTVVAAADLVAAMERRGWSWAVWTYKGVNIGGWAAMNYYSTLKYDLAADSYEAILAKWTTDLTRWQDAAAPANHWFTDWWVEGYRVRGPRAE